ncbi:MAG: T9SS type A sorting domain-containing protein [Bacteroidota bacterium]
MKKALLLLTAGLISYSGYSQDPQLIDNDWFLHNLILDGENNIPYNTGVSMNIDFLFDNGTNEYIIGLPASFEYFTYQVTYHPTDPEFTTTYLVSLTEGVCNIPGGPCDLFFQLYEPFYFDYQETPMTYEITDNGNGTLQLVVTNIDGDQAIYNTFLLGNETRTAVSFKLVPNPTSDVLSLISENQAITSLIIYSITGNKVMQPFVINQQIDVSILPTGLYFLEILTENGSAVERFIKE